MSFMRTGRTSEKWSDAQLLEYSKVHLKYEISMFFGTGIQLSTIQFPPDGTADIYKNALIESFATHLRNLLLFLYPDRPHEKDVIAHDFFSDTVRDWPCHKPKIPRELSDALIRSHREISHLTVDRRDGKNASKDWFFLNLMQELIPVLKQFTENASPEKLHADVKLSVDSVQLGTTRSPITDASTKTIAVTFAGATNSIRSESYSSWVEKK